MNEEQYWIIEVEDFTNRPQRRVGRGHYLQYYPPGIEGAVAEIVFTDPEDAKQYAAQACNSEHMIWSVVFVGNRSDLGIAIQQSIPTKTHVLLDPEYGDEEASLQPIVWQ